MTDKEIDLLQKMMEYTVYKSKVDGKDKIHWFNKIQEIKQQLLKAGEVK